MLIRSPYRSYVQFDDTTYRTSENVQNKSFTLFRDTHIYGKRTQTCMGINTKFRIVVTSAEEEENVAGEAYTVCLNYA